MLMVIGSFYSENKEIVTSVKFNATCVLNLNDSHDDDSDHNSDETEF